MKFLSLKQAKIVTGATAADFQDNLNKALAEVAEKGAKHELTFNMNAGYCAYLVYEERIAKPESLSEEYEMRNEGFRCSECPMFRPSPDKRIKYTTCEHGVRRCAANDWACEWFYIELEKGGLKPND